MGNNVSANEDFG